MCHLSSNATGGCLKLINSNLHVMKVNKLQIKVNLELFNFSVRKIEVAIVLVNLLTDLKRMNFSIFSFKQTDLVLVFFGFKTLYNLNYEDRSLIHWDQKFINRIQPRYSEFKKT